MELKVPRHIAIILDGNGRWAKKRGLPRVYGHKKGMERVKQVVREAKNLGVKAVTVFAFSTENWTRPKQEIKVLFSYLHLFLNHYKKKFVEEDMKFNVIGRRDRFNKRTLKKIQEVEKVTKNNKSFTFNVALDYGGRWDIVEAAKRIVKDVSAKEMSESDIDEEVFGRYLSLGDMPDPDLLIRTSGEQRISNFLIWDLAYSEFYFTDVYWPDFDKKQLRHAVEVYSQRQRRYGGIDE